MVPKTLNQKLRTVDQRLAKVDRKLGFLQGRLYFRSAPTDEWQEVPIFSLEDGGVTPKNAATGEEISARRYTAKVNRDWLDVSQGKLGFWAIRVRDGDTLLKVEKENERTADLDTFGVLEFRVTQEIAIKMGGDRARHSRHN